MAAIRADSVSRARHRSRRRTSAVWHPPGSFHTGERRPPGPKGSSFEDTPILADGRLLVCTPTDRVFALDPVTGHAIWAFDPELSPGLQPASDFLCRGLAVWRDAAAGPGADCRTRVGSLRST
jgi:quinoprotein glucose dehydrogenase